jgi:hypothetical protein
MRNDTRRPLDDAHFSKLCSVGGGSGGGGSAPTTTTSINKSEPPAYVQPYSEQLLTRAGQLSNAPYQAYTGQMIQPLNATQQQGLQMTIDRATQGSPLMNASNAELTKTASGAYLDPTTNPAWASMAKGITDAYSKGTAAQTDAAFARAGAFGGSAYRDQTQTNQAALGGALAGAAGNLYNDERLNQLRATQQAPQMATADYQNAQALLGAGDVYRQEGQDQLNQQYQQFLQQQQWPYQNLDVLANAIRTSMGGGGTSTTTAPNPYQSNRTAGALGGGLLGYGAGQMIGGSIAPYAGAGIGALAGGLAF